MHVFLSPPNYTLIYLLLTVIGEIVITARFLHNNYLFCIFRHDYDLDLRYTTSFAILITLQY